MPPPLICSSAWATATIASTRLLPRVGRGPLVPAGLALAAVGVAYLTGIDAGSSYVGAVLPGIILTVTILCFDTISRTLARVLEDRNELAGGVELEAGVA